METFITSSKSPKKETVRKSDIKIRCFGYFLNFSLFYVKVVRKISIEKSISKLSNFKLSSSFLYPERK